MTPLRTALTGLFLATTLLSSAPVGAAETAPSATQPTNQPWVTIPLRRGRDLVYAKATVDGVDVGYLIVDTGSSITSLNSDIVQQRGLRRIGRRWVNTQRGTVIHDVVVAPSLKIGAIELTDHPVYVDPHPSPLTPTKEQIAGVLGIDVLATGPFKIDFYNATLSLYRARPVAPPPGTVEIDLKLGTDTPLVAGALEKSSGWFEVDTAHGSGLMLSPAFVEMNPHLVRGRMRMNETVPWGEDAEIYTTRWSSFEIFGRDYGRTYGEYPAGPKGIVGAAALVGPQFFYDSPLLIDMKARKLWVNPQRSEDTVEAFLRRFPVSAERDLAGYYSLHHAAYRLHVEGAKALLSQGADPNVTDAFGISPIIIAAGRGNAALTKTLLKAGAKIDMRTQIDGFTALLLAARYGRNETVAALLEANDDINRASKSGRTPLFLAAEADYPETVKLLLERGAKVDKPLTSGETPLMAAAMNGNPTIVSALLDHGVDPNKMVDSGSPLICAAQSASAECVRLLLRENAQINASRPDGVTPLAAAAQSYRAADCVELLIKAGADVKAISKDGRTILDFAVQSGSAQNVKLIVTALKSAGNK